MNDNINDKQMLIGEIYLVTTSTDKELIEKQMTKDDAIAFFDRGDWKPMSETERAVFQLHQDCLCMPFDVFHKSIEVALGRPVWTHEFGLNRNGLKEELAAAEIRRNTQ